ncbi:MAG: UDP-N-acetylglucosamine 2-epimerase [Acidobacteriaceae bacterium]
MSRRIGVVTVARSDYGIYFPVLKLLQSDSDFDLQLIVAAAHFSPQFGNTIEEIEKDGFPISARVPVPMQDDSQQEVARAIGEGLHRFAATYEAVRPDILLVLGDRYEMFAAATAALPLRIPVAHIHGGELTLGAIDDAMRHCITKLSHIHFAATEEYGRRIRQLGEEPWRVHVTGSPVVDVILGLQPITKQQLESEIGLDLPGSLLVTFHPVTLDEAAAPERISNLLDALAQLDFSLIFTYPNADSGSNDIIREVRMFVKERRNARLFPNLGFRKYQSLQKYVAAMVGNSSSGFVEAACARLPVVNIGSRQEGRLRTPNIIDVPCDVTAIVSAIRKATDPAVRESAATMKNPYGDGHSAEKIVATLKALPPRPKLLKKKFQDITKDTQ